MEVLYSKPGKPCCVTFDRETLGIACEFIIAVASEGLSQSPSVQMLSNTPAGQQMRQPSAQSEEQDYDNGFDEAGVGWGMEMGMSPARTTEVRKGDGDDDLYDEPMQEVEEEEVPPTQQERYQGIFDS